MKAIQVLTEESILKLKKVLIYLEVIQNNIPTDIGSERIKDLKEIIEDVES